MNKKGLLSLCLALGMGLTACNKNENDPAGQEKDESAKTTQAAPSLVKVAAVKGADGSFKVEGTFDGDVSDLEKRLAASSVNASYSDDSWVSPSVNFNLDFIEYFMGSFELLKTFGMYQVGDLEPELMEEIMGSSGGATGGAPEEEEDPAPKNILQGWLLGLPGYQDLNKYGAKAGILQLLGNLSVESHKSLARFILATVGDYFSGFAVDGDQAILSNPLDSAMLYVAKEADVVNSVVAGPAAATEEEMIKNIVGQLVGILYSIDIKDGIISADGIANVLAANPARLEPGTHFAFALDGNYTCDPILRMENLYDLIEALDLAGVAFYDFDATLDVLLANDLNDKCLADLRGTLQDWLDEELGRGVARIPDGGVSTSILDMFGKTTVVFELDNVLDLDGKLAGTDISDEFTKNLATFAGVDLSKVVIPVKALKLPAALVRDIDGRANRAYTFNLANILAVEGALSKMVEGVSVDITTLLPTAKAFAGTFDSKYASQKYTVLDDSKMVAGETVTLEYRSAFALTMESCQKVSYLMQKDGIKLACKNTTQYVDDDGNTIAGIVFQALDNIDLPLTVTIPAGMVENKIGLANAVENTFVINDVTLPEVVNVLVGFVSASPEKRKAGFVSGDIIKIVFSEKIDVSALYNDLQDYFMENTDSDVEPTYNYGENYFSLRLLSDKPDGATVFTIPASYVKDLKDNDIDGTEKQMAADYAVKLDLKKAINDYRGNGKITFTPSKTETDREHNMLYKKDKLTYMTSFYKDVFKYAAENPSGAIPSDERPNGEIFYFVPDSEMPNGMISLSLSMRSTNVYIDGDEIVFTLPEGYTDPTGVDWSDFKMTLSAADINKYIRNYEINLNGLEKNDWTADASYRYFFMNDCGDSTLMEQDIIVIDFGTSGYFANAVFDYEMVASALSTKFGSDENPVQFDCGHYATETTTTYWCTVIGGSVDLSQEQTVTIEATDDHGKLTINMPAADSFSLKAYTRGSSDHDGKLLAGDQLIVEAGCFSNSVIGALVMEVQDKVSADLSMVTYDKNNFYHRNRVIFEYNGAEALDLTTAVNIEIPSLLDDKGSVLPATGLSISEAAKDDSVTFNFVAGSVNGNKAIFAAKDAVAAGVWDIDEVAGMTAADGLQIVCDDGSQEYKNDTLFNIVQFAKEAASLVIDTFRQFSNGF